MLFGRGLGIEQIRLPRRVHSKGGPLLGAMTRTYLCAGHHLARALLRASTHPETQDDLCGGAVQLRESSASTPSYCTSTTKPYQDKLEA
jgi:hypothetical protein